MATVIALCLALPNTCTPPVLDALHELHEAAVAAAATVEEEHSHSHPTPAPRPPAPPPAPSPGVEAWRPLVAAHFPADQVDRALCIIGHESRGDPTATNPSSGAAGLFQHLPKYWAERSSKAGWAGADIYDPEANTAVAAWLQATGGWTHWSPYNRGLCH